MAAPDYFTLAEFRLLPDMADEDTYTDDEVNAAAAYFAAIIEREVGAKFSVASATESFDGARAGGYRGREIRLGHQDAVALTTVTVDGTTVSNALLTLRSGVVRYLDQERWSYTQPGNVTITYTYGTACPADIKDAVMWATRDRLLAQNDQNDSDPRRTSVTTEMGTVSYLLPGEKRPTGFPELDALIASYQRNTPSFGFA